MMHDLLLESTDWSSRGEKKQKNKTNEKESWSWRPVACERFFFLGGDLVRLWVSLLESVLQAWLCFYSGSTGSISVWGPVVGRSHTVAPRGAVFPPEFTHLWSNVCLSPTILHLPPSLIPFFFTSPLPLPIWCCPKAGLSLSIPPTPE